MQRESAVFVWTDRALFLGDRSETALHAHNAIEISIALDDLGVLLAAPGTPTVFGVGAALVRSDANHRLSIPGPKVAVLYLDPRSPAGAGLESWLGGADIAAVPEAITKPRRAHFAALFDKATGLPEAAAACDDLVSALVPPPPPPKVDARAEKAMRFVGERLDEPPTLAEVAAHVKLSPGRIGHLFKEQVGLPLRRYVLWMRLRQALLRSLEGANMADAAHAAGFADSAHFSRTCKKTFGLPPSAFAPVDDVFVAE